jgi:hypothetical protein
MSKKQLPVKPEPKEAVVTAYENDEVQKYKTFDDMIKTFKARIREQDKNQLLLNWELGGQVKLLSDGATYGSKTVQDMADKLDCSDSMLYSIKRLFETYPRALIDKFIEKGLHYHTVVQLTGKNTDEDTRDNIVQKLLSGQITSRDLPELLGREPKKKVDAAKEVDAEVVDEDGDTEEEKEEREGAAQLHKAAVTDPVEDLEEEVKGLNPKDPKSKVVTMLSAVDNQILQMEKSILTIDPLMDIMEDVDEPKDIEKLMERVGHSMANLQKLNMRINEVVSRMKRMAM